MLSAARDGILGTFRLIIRPGEDLSAAEVMASLDCCRTFIYQNCFCVLIRQVGSESRFPFVGLSACLIRASQQISGRSCEVKWLEGGMNPCNQALHMQNTYMAKYRLNHLCC